MARIKYYYDTETCKYERVRTSTSDIILNMLGLFSLAAMIAVAFVMLLFFSNIFESPKELMLRNEVKEMEFYYENMNEELVRLDNILKGLEYRDDNLYRKVLGAEPIDKSIRDAGIGGAERYKEILDKDMIHEDLIIKLSGTVDRLKRKIYLELKSQDEVKALAEEKEKLFAAIPAIQPIANKELIALASGYGVRIHPVYKVRKMHTGIDFAAPIGTHIYATADGIVDEVQVSFSGYGKMIEIDHGFGYRTRYAHMHGFAVQKGQKIKRGELIGYVGDTGLSTAPHLHYEVFINGTHVNPVHYFFNDLNAAEYEKLVALASVENQALGQ